MAFSAFGTRPGKDRQSHFKSSAQFDPEKNVFHNRRPHIHKEMKDRMSMISLLAEWFKKGKDRVPEKPLPEVKPDLNEFLKPSKNLKVIWFGHSTFLLNFDGKIILVDPVFSGSAAPFSFMVKRFQKPVLKRSELPPIDIVLISHDHYDHLDMESIQHFQGQDVQFITPLGVGSHLIGWGIEKSRIEERDWWQAVKVGDIEFIAAPAQHFSGRDGLHENSTLWASWVIRNQFHNIYFSGDSGYDIHFQEIGEKLGPFDIAFIENGQYNPDWKEVHLLPEDSVQAYFDLKAKRFFPVHWGMFELAFHPWYEPIEKLHKASLEKGIDLISPRLGEVISIDGDYKVEPWWKTR